MIIARYFMGPHFSMANTGAFVDKRNWIELSQDVDTGIESIRAHFEGHAYDPHWHDSYLIGYTEIGVQQFNCRRRRHDSTAGQVFLVEPGEIHDGRAPIAGGFELPEAKSQLSWIDADTVYVGTDFGPGSLTDSGYVRIIKRWQRGTPLSAAETAAYVKSPDFMRRAAADGADAPP